MKKYNVGQGHLLDAGEVCGGVDVYLASEVDARDAETFMTMRKDRQRIDELERALKSCAAVIKRQLKHVDDTTAVAVQALDEADQALSL